MSSCFRLTHIGNSDGADDLAGGKLPQTKSVRTLDTESRLEDSDRDNEVRSEDDVLLEINGQTVRRELLSENVECAVHIFGPLVDNVKVRVGLDQATWRSSSGGTHVGDEETTSMN